MFPYWFNLKNSSSGGAKKRDIKSRLMSCSFVRPLPWRQFASHNLHVRTWLYRSLRPVQTRDKSARQRHMSHFTVNICRSKLRHMSQLRSSACLIFCLWDKFVSETNSVSERVSFREVESVSLSSHKQFSWKCLKYLFCYLWNFLVI